MSNFKTYYTIKPNFKNSGSLMELLEKVKKGNDIKIKLNAIKEELEKYEEIISFTNIAYNNEDIIGMVPYHRASLSTHSFDPKERNFYNKEISSPSGNEYNCFFSYCTNKVNMTFRTDKNKTPMPGHREKSAYGIYKWLSTNDDWQLVFESDKDFNDNKKKDYLIKSLKDGQELKIGISLDNWNYIIRPNIIYFYKDSPNSTDENVSLKTYPIILYGKNFYKDENSSFQELELLVNSNGISSVAKTCKHVVGQTKTNTLKKIYNIFNKKTEFEKLNLNTKWFLKK
jgi:hypothetical protein